MRKLTIKRTKSFVACLAKTKIYVEDPLSTDLVINNISCRKLGELKNNEEKTFKIGEEQAKVFAIVDKVSKEYCNDFFQIPAGQEDITLTGKHKYNPANGNAFRFDGNEGHDVQKNRKKGFKIGLLVLCAAIAVGGVVGAVIGFNLFSGPKTEPKTFTENGMRITLTNEFKSTQMEGYTNCYDSAKVAVFAIKEEFTLAEGFGDYTLEQYGELVIQNNSYAASAALKKIDGLTGFEYDWTNPETNDTYRYYSFVYKADDAFWLVQFAVLTENVETYGSRITQWAKTVSFQ